MGDDNVPKLNERDRGRDVHRSTRIKDPIGTGSISKTLVRDRTILGQTFNTLAPHFWCMCLSKLSIFSALFKWVNFCTYWQIACFFSKNLTVIKCCLNWGHDVLKTVSLIIHSSMLWYKNTNDTVASPISIEKCKNCLVVRFSIKNFKPKNWDRLLVRKWIQSTDWNSYI